ncbi:hypothetical protein MPTK1_6g05500 [Marchantia polymorpha subsp. ruderalis]|uniref:Uncharacterized protein n=1 Tax=Marchantia polymorpha subsp. ruderalis TaxID=1480154 RepID=A0A176WJI9_MARPO|nr:hypothetical protein AXG93_4123s1030 [Marchantia polymorpha subsp. ruderalis]BBN13673.1 hypothetical protein Mp_6g05500 [Marchantia polymorpha subsp. ruderalis]
MEIASIPVGRVARGGSQSGASCKANGECCRGMMRFRRLFFFVSCSLLLTVVFMAVDQFSHLPRFSSSDGAAYKQSYKQSYNHGANRGPHLGQKPRSMYGDSQSRSRKLLGQVPASFSRDFSVPVLPAIEQEAVQAVPLT